MKYTFLKSTEVPARLFSFLSPTTIKGCSALLIASMFGFLAMGFSALDVSAESTGVLIPRNFSFNSTLQLGTVKNPDVAYLQRFLNYDVRTRLTNPDPCITTDLTYVYDARTRDAVMRFQNLYASEILAPLGLRSATGIVAGNTRNKINALLKTSQYESLLATSSPASAVNSNSAAVDAYYARILQTLTNPQSTSTTKTNTSTLTEGVSTSTKQTIDSYFAFINNQTDAKASSTTKTSVSGSAQSSSTVNPYLYTAYASSSNPWINAYFTTLNTTLNSTSAPQATSSPNTNTSAQTAGNNQSSGQTSTTDTSATSAYLTYVNSVLSGNTSSSNNNSTATTASTNPAVAAYYASINQSAGTNLPTNGLVSNTSAVTASSSLNIPTLTAVSPIFISSCDEQITIVGRNFSATNNYLVGTLGYISNASSTPVIESVGPNGSKIYTPSPTASTSLRAITFNLRQFSEYNVVQEIYAGTTQNVTVRVQVGNTPSNQAAVLVYAFPGTPNPRYTNPLTYGTANLPGIPESTQSSGQSSNTTSSGGSTNTSSGNNSSNASIGQGANGILTTIESTDKKLFGYTPQGALIKLIGGDKAVDMVYSVSPNGHLNQKLQGKLPGVVSITSGNGGFGGGSGSGNSSSGSASGLLGALGGVAGGAALSGAGGGTSATGIQNFGGRITSTYTCTCSANTLVYIQDVRGQSLQLMYQPGASILYMNYNISAGVNVLGDYTSGGQCLVYAGESCTTEGSPQGTIRQIGTSMTAGS